MPSLLRLFLFSPSLVPTVAIVVLVLCDFFVVAAAPPPATRPPSSPSWRPRKMGRFEFVVTRGGRERTSCLGT